MTTPVCREGILDACGVDSNLADGAWALAPAPSPPEAPLDSSNGGSSGGGGVGSSAGGGSGGNATLPDGRIALFLSIATGPVPCYNYTPGGERNWTADPDRGLWGESQVQSCHMDNERGWLRGSGPGMPCCLGVLAASQPALSC